MLPLSHNIHINVVLSIRADEAMKKLTLPGLHVFVV